MSVDTAITDAVGMMPSRTLVRLRPLFTDLHGEQLSEPEIFHTGAQA